MTKKFNENSIIYDDDIKIIDEEEINQSPVMRMNINSSMIGSLESTLENIYNTLKDVPDMKSKQHPEHKYSSLDGREPTLKEDVHSALGFVREMEDIVLPISYNYFFPNGEEDFTDEMKELKNIVIKSVEEEQR